MSDLGRQYFAQLDLNNVVIDIAVVMQDFLEANPEQFSGVWVETFWGDANKTFASIGDTYDEVTQDFVRPPRPVLPAFDASSFDNSFLDET